MGTGSTPTVLSGLVVTDPRFRWSAYDGDASTLTEQGPLAGVPEAQDDTALVLEAVGQQANGSQLRVKTIRAGHPGADKAQFVWKNEADADTEWRGWDPPVSITGFEFIDRSTTSGEWRDFHARKLDDDTLCVVADNNHTNVVCWTRDPDTGNWTDNAIYERSSSQTYSFFPCCIVLPTGRILCFFWLEDSDGDYNIRNYYSDDGGFEWLPGQKGCLSADVDPADYEPGWIRGDYLNGQLMFVIHQEEQSTPEDRFFQYASNDLGATFDLVKEWEGKDHRFVDVLSHGGKLHVAYISESDAGQYRPYMRSVASAYEDFTAATLVLMQADTDTMEWATQSGGLYNSGNISLWADDDGVLWVMGREHAAGALANHEVAVRCSLDGGETWQDVGGGPADHHGVSTWRGMDDSTFPSYFACVAVRGRTAVIHRCEADAASADDSMMLMWLGGYTTVCQAQESGRGTVSLRTVTGWTNTWLPYNAPEDQGLFTASSTGTATLTSSGLHLVTGNPQSEYRLANNLPGSLSEGVTVLAQCRLVDNQCRVEVRWNDSVAEEYEVAAIVKETEIVLWDLVDGAEIDSIATTDGVDNRIQLLIDCYNNNAVLWYRVVDLTRDDRQWIKVGETTSCLDNGAITAPGHRVRFGQSDDSDSYWMLVCLASDYSTGEHIYGQDNYSDLLGKNYAPTPVYVDGGCSIQAIDGPTMRNEDWGIDARAEYPVANVFSDVASSPRRVWRSEDDNSDVDIVVDVTGRSVLTPPLGGLLACYLGNANFGYCFLEGSNTAGTAWTRIAKLDLSSLSLKYTREDRMVLPDTSGSNAVGHYIHGNALADSHFKFTSNKVRKIQTNTPGSWRASGTSLQTRLLLEEVDDSEATSGSLGEIWFKDGLFVLAHDTSYRKYRLVIPAQTTAEGWLELGVWQLGHFYPTGGYLMSTGWGRGQEWASKVEQVEGRSGIRSVQALEPQRRAVEVAWVDGVDGSQLSVSNPNWIIGWTGGEPVAVPADVPWSVPGLLGLLQGAKTPVTYCAALAVPSGLGSYDLIGQENVNVERVLDPALLLHGRVVTESIRGDTVLGDADSNELIRVGVVRIEEET